MKADSSCDLSKIFIINHDNCLINFWNSLDIICCLVSSYIYAWLSFFGTDTEQEYNLPLFMTIGFESIFTFSIIFKLLTTFVPEGEIVPITNHELIF